MTFCALGENIEDQAVAIDHSRFQRLLEVTLLAWAQNVIENHDFDLVGDHGLFEFFGFTAANEHFCVRTATAPS